MYIIYYILKKACIAYIRIYVLIYNIRQSKKWCFIIAYMRCLFEAVRNSECSRTFSF